MIDSFGGVVTSIDRSDLNNGLAAQSVDVEYFPGGCKSRGPFTGYLTSAASGPLAASPVTSILSFPHPDGHRERLFLHANGTLASEYPEGTVNTIETGLASTIMRGCVLNNRAWMAFSSVEIDANGLSHNVPTTRPRWWNGTWLDPVGTEGPYGQMVWTSSTGAGHATASAPGNRRFSVSYETRGGFVTMPTQSLYIGTINDLDRYEFNNMPIPPGNVVKSRVNITTNLGTDFYSPPSLVQSPAAGDAFIASPPVLAPGYSDTEIAAAGAGFTMTHARLNLFVLPPCLGLEAYNSRLVAWGALNYIPPKLFTADNDPDTVIPPPLNFPAGMANLSFDAGINFGFGTIPMGWNTPGDGTEAGGELVENDTDAGVSGGAWKITGNGATAIRGQLRQFSGLDRQFAYPPGVAYRVRILARKSSGLTAGRLVFASNTGDPDVTLDHSELSETFEWYDRPLIAADNATVGTPALYGHSNVDGAMTNNQSITVDDILVYPESVPNLNSYLLISEVNDLETFDYQRGMYGVNPGDGQSVVNVQTLRGTMYVFKERSLWGVNDNGQAPYLWDKASLMSDTVGCLSVHGVGRGDGYLVTITESGVYVFAGGQPQKISQENQPLWDTVNFNYRHLAWCVVDPDAQRIYIGVPTNGSTFVNELFVIDYVSGLDVDPIGSPGNGRKWSQWTPPGTPGFPCGARIDRDNGQRLFVVGGGICRIRGFRVVPQAHGVGCDARHLRQPDAEHHRRVRDGHDWPTPGAFVLRVRVGQDARLGRGRQGHARTPRWLARHDRQPHDRGVAAPRHRVADRTTRYPDRPEVREPGRRNVRDETRGRVFKENGSLESQRVLEGVNHAHERLPEIPRGVGRAGAARPDRRATAAPGERPDERRRVAVSPAAGPAARSVVAPSVPPRRPAAPARRWPTARPRAATPEYGDV